MQRLREVHISGYKIVDSRDLHYVNNFIANSRAIEMSSEVITFSNYSSLLHEYINIGSIDLLQEYSREIPKECQSETRLLISKNLHKIADINSYPYKDTFAKLAKYHKDVTSPLRRLPIFDDYIVITPSQKIPYSYEIFLDLLLKTSLKGMRILFDVELKGGVLGIVNPSDSHVSFTIDKIGHETYVTVSDTTKNESIYDLEEDDEGATQEDIMKCVLIFFSPGEEVPYVLESNGYLIFLQSDDIESEYLIEETLLKGKKGYLTCEEFNLHFPERPLAYTTYLAKENVVRTYGLDKSVKVTEI